MPALLATILPFRAWALALLAGFVLAASLAGWMTITRAEARAAVADAARVKADAARLVAEAQVRTLAASLERQNKAVADANRMYQEKLAGSEQAAAEARKALAAVTARAEQLKKETVPKDCAGASTWSVSRVSEIGQRWNAGGAQ